MEDGSPTISDFSATTWLKKERPKHAIYPHKADYCDYCAKVKANIQEKQTSINRKLQSGSADGTEIAQLEKDKHWRINFRSTKTLLASHYSTIRR